MPVDGIRANHQRFGYDYNIRSAQPGRRSVKVSRPVVFGVAFVSTVAACNSMTPIDASGTTTIFRVTNSSKATYALRAWFPVPGVPGTGGRYLFLRSAPPGISCVAFDWPVATLTNEGTGRTDTVWTNHDSLHLLAYPDGSDTATAWSADFVPADHPYWSIALPGHDVPAVAATGC